MTDSWDRQTYEREKRNFIERRVNQAPLWTHFTCMFGGCWGAAWLCSWLVLKFFGDSHAWARSLPVRYGIAFLFAYLCFFVAVRVWIDFAKREPEHRSADSVGLQDIGDGASSEGCLVVVAVLVIGFIVGGLFFALGGAPLLLEAVFEAAFAGVVVRSLSGNLVLGDWKMRLLKNTWLPAIGALLVLLAIAASLHKAAPQATTFAQAVTAIRNR